MNDMFTTNEMFTTEEKLDYIYSLETRSCLSEDEWTCLKTLFVDKDVEVRYSVAELLALFPSVRSEQMLLERLGDSNRLVRACICDSLAFSTSHTTLEKLMYAAGDRVGLVRGYAVLSIADVQLNMEFYSQETIEFLKELEKRESNSWVRIAVFRSLFLLGEYTYGQKLLSMVGDKSYKNRSAALSMLEELLENPIVSYLPNLAEVLKQQLSVERAYAVKLKLSRIIEKISA